MVRRALRWLRNGLLALVGLVLLALVAVHVALLTDGGREYVRVEVERLLGDSLDARVSIERIEALSAFHLRARGVRLVSEHGELLAAVGELDARIAPLDLVREQVHLTELSLGRPFVELGAPLEENGGGLLGLFAKPEQQAEPEAESSGGGIAILIDRIRLRDAEVQATVSGTACALRSLAAEGALELADALDLRVTSLHGVIERASASIGAIDRASGRYGGRGSRVDASLKVGQSALTVKGRLDPPDSRGAQPLRASVRAREISRESLAALGFASDWPRSPVDLQLEAHGDLTAVDAQLVLEAAEGRVNARAHYAPARGVILEELNARSGSAFVNAHGELLESGEAMVRARIYTRDLTRAPALAELVSGLSGELAASVAVDRSAEGMLAASVDATWLEPRLSTARARSLKISGRLRGAELEHARARLDVAIDQLDAGPVKLARARLALRGEGDRYRLAGDLGERGSLRASAERRAGDWRLDGGLDLQLAPPHGTLNVSARVRGALEAPRVTVRGEYRCPQFEGLRNFAVAATVDGDLRTRRVHADGRLLASGTSARLTLDSRLRGLSERGVRRGRHEVALVIDRLPLHALARWPRAPAVPRSAVLSGRLDMNGTLERYALETALRVNARFAEGDQPLDAWFTAKYADERVALALRATDRRGPLLRTQMETELEGPRLALDELDVPRLLVERSWNASVWLGARRIDELPSTRALGVPEELWPARVSMDGALAHEPGEEPKGKLEAKAIWDPPAKTSDAPLCGLGGNPHVALAAGMASGKLNATLTAGSAGRDGIVMTFASNAPMDEWLQIEPAQVRPVSADVLFRDFELGDVPILCERARGKVSGRARLERALTAAAEVHADVRARGLRFPDTPPVDLQLTASAADQQITGKGTLCAKGGDADIFLQLPLDSGGRVPTVPLDQPVRLDAKFRSVPAGALVGFAPNVRASSGTLGGWLGVRDTLTQPTLRGRLDLREVTMTLGEIGQRFERATGTITIEGRKLSMRHLRFTDLGGRADVSAELDLHTLEPLAFDARFEAKAKGLPIRRGGVLAAHLDGTIHADIAVEPQRTDVRATLRKARIELADRATTQPQSLDPNPDIVFAGEPPPELREEADSSQLFFKIDASQPFWVRRSDFSALVSTVLTIESGADGPSVVGTVKVERGVVELLGQLFDIERGTIEFTGGRELDPTLDLTASRRIPGAGGSVVQVQAQGPVHSPELSFEVDGQPATAGAALAAALGTRAGPGGDANVQQEMSALATGIAGSVLTLGARRELGPWVPVFAIERGAGETRARAGIEADRFIPSFLRPLVVDAYVEGIVSSQETTENGKVSGQNQTGAAALLELRFPHDLTTEAQYGPGQRWSLDLGWEP